jgi:predicted GIY-YIG superfamily endonuclease
MRKYNKENCLSEALKYSTKKEFYELSRNFYDAAHRYKWLDEITKHLIGQNRGYWKLKTNCLQEALKYSTIGDFSKNASSAYSSACKNKWLNEITSHMTHLGNKYKRCIYSYEFDDNNVYIGLTYNLEKRNIQHYSDIKSSVYIHMNKTGIIPRLIKLTDYIEVSEAQKMEYHFFKKYTNSGFFILNKVKTGGVGGKTIKWTEERCLEEALKYTTVTDFNKNSKAAYDKSKNVGWFNNYTHLKKSISWTKERCHEEALKYNDKKTYSMNSNSSYSIACRNGWVKEICSHMK